MTTAGPEHDQVAELLGVYALDAVEPDESRLVEEHLVACPRCTAELNALRHVAAGLAVSGELESAEPPPALWHRIADTIGETIGDGTTERGRDASITPIRRRLGGSSGWGTAGRRPVWLAIAGAAAAAIALLAVNLVDTQGRVDQLQSALAGRGPHSAVEAALSSPDHQVVDLRSSDGAQLAEIVVQRNGTGYFVHSSMTELPSNETYQLWASIDGKPISLGLLGRRPSAGISFSLGTSVSAARELMVTDEPAGGVSTPDRAPIATAPLAIA